MPLYFKQSSFDVYREMYHSFGLGVKTGIDLPGEAISSTHNAQLMSQVELASEQIKYQALTTSITSEFQRLQTVIK